MKRFFLVLFLLLLLFTITVSSHPGRTDSNGGHWDRKEGTYHYHSGEHAGESSSGGSSETADDIEPEVNIVETAPSEETKEEPSEKVIVMKKETPTKEESSTKKENSTGIDSKTIIIIVAIVVGGVVLFLIARQVIKHYSADEFFDKLFFIVLIIVGVIILRGCKNSETYDSHIKNCDGTCAHIEEHCKDYFSQIDDLEQELEEEIKTCKRHDDYCDGQCDHIEDEIDDRVYDGELISSYEALDEEDLNDSYWEGVYYGYIQGYGDCYYGNTQEQELDEYVDEELF